MRGQLRPGGLALIIRSTFPENVGKAVRTVKCIGRVQPGDVVQVDWTSRPILIGEAGDAWVCAAEGGGIAYGLASNPGVAVGYRSLSLVAASRLLPLDEDGLIQWGGDEMDMLASKLLQESRA